MAYFGLFHSKPTKQQKDRYRQAPKKYLSLNSELGAIDYRYDWKCRGKQRADRLVWTLFSRNFRFCKPAPPPFPAAAPAWAALFGFVM